LIEDVEVGSGGLSPLRGLNLGTFDQGDSSGLQDLRLMVRLHVHVAFG